MEIMVHYISLHFDHLASVFCMLLFFMFFYWITSAWRTPWRHLLTTSRDNLSILSMSFLISSTLSFGAYKLIMEGYRSLWTVDIGERLITDTEWLKDDREIFFIVDDTLKSIRLQGAQYRDIFQATGPIRGYYFSPDGRYLLIVTTKELVLLDLPNAKTETIDTFSANIDLGNIQNVFHNILWAPDNQKFLYERSYWSKFSSDKKLYLYAIATKKKKEVPVNFYSRASVYWDTQSESLYSVRFEVKDMALKEKEFNLRLRALPLSTFKMESVANIVVPDEVIPADNLKARGIELFMGNSKLGFTDSPALVAESSKGYTLWLDRDDRLCYKENSFYNRKLLHVPRLESFKDSSSSEKIEKSYVPVYEMRWLPGDRYVIIGHSYLGVLVLEPLSGKIGQLKQVNGHAFGWYDRI